MYVYICVHVYTYTYIDRYRYIYICMDNLRREGRGAHPEPSPLIPKP